MPKPPGGQIGAAFPRPTTLPSGPRVLGQPGGPWSSALAARRPGWWPRGNAGQWARPTAGINNSRNVTMNPGNVTLNNQRSASGLGNRGGYPRPHPYQLQGHLGRHPYALGGYYAAASYAPYHGYSGYSGYYPYDSTSSGDEPSYGSYQTASASSQSNTTTETASSGSGSTSALYAQPSGEGDTQNSDEAAQAVDRIMEGARKEFQKAEYADAQSACERAIRLLPDSADLHEFRGLCQFARGQYKEAAGSLYAVLAVRPGWDWKTLGSFYPAASGYARHLRSLERHVKENPKDAAGRFVLTYHYLALDQAEAATAQLREVSRLLPRDKLFPVMLEALERVQDGKEGAKVRGPARD